MVKIPPANARDMGFVPGLGKLRILWDTSARMPSILSPSAATTEFCNLEPSLRNKLSYTMNSQCTTTREKTPLTASTEGLHAQQRPRSGRCEHIHGYIVSKYFPGGSDGKASVYNTGDLGLIPGSGRSAGEGNGNPLQHYCLENPMDIHSCVTYLNASIY